MANITYKRTFQHQDWIDNEDVIQAGGPRGFNLEFHSLEGEFDTLSGVVSKLNAGLTFQPLGGGAAVSYNLGSVGIGPNFTALNPPTYRLQVDLGNNIGVIQQARFGNAVCCNGTTNNFGGYAYFAHWNFTADTDYALRQSPNGAVNINAKTGQVVSICQNGTAPRLAVSSTGNVIVGGDSDLGAPPPAAGALPSILQVAGDAYKLTPGNNGWQVPSDARLKEDVRDLDVGLAQLRQVRPVRFRTNGRAGIQAGQECIGVLGQEIEKVFPEMVRRVPEGVPGDPGLEDLRIYNGSALAYVVVNAVKELAEKIERLEKALAVAGGRP